jgi:hypothetical protein
LDGYTVYKDSLSGFPVDSFHIVGTVSGDSNSFLDLSWTPSQIYYYRVAAFDTTGHTSAGSPELMVIATTVRKIEEEQSGILPTTYALYQNFPNPFNMSTNITFYLPDTGPQPAKVELKIFNILGGLVRTLVDESLSPGKYLITWDGRGKSGETLSSGVYLYQLELRGEWVTEAVKMTLVK